MTWIKISVTLKADGSKVITYVSRENPRLRIESRKEQMPHANGIGFWWFTSYSVLLDGKTVKTRHTLKEAKAFAEGLEV